MRFADIRESVTDYRIVLGYFEDRDFVVRYEIKRWEDAIRTAVPNIPEHLVGEGVDVMEKLGWDQWHNENHWFNSDKGMTFTQIGLKQRSVPRAPGTGAMWFNSGSWKPEIRILSNLVGLNTWDEAVYQYQNMSPGDPESLERLDFYPDEYNPTCIYLESYHAGYGSMMPFDGRYE